jgi:hypothetical protein
MALSIMLLVVAASFPLQIMMIYSHSPEELSAVFAKLAPLNWVVAIGCVGIAYMAHRGSRLMWFMFPLLSFVVAWNNWLVSVAGEDFSALTTALATLGFASLGTMLLTNQAWEVLLHPERRWWLTPQRKKITAPVFIIPQQGEAFRAETFDISAQGAFIPINNGDMFTAFRNGDKISLRLTMGALTVLRCEAQVVRRNSAKGMYPTGVGIQFLNLNRNDSRELRKYLNTV